jgi:DUF917 family protein
MPRKVGVREIEDIAVGAAIMGTGGGGDPYIGKLMAISAIEKYGEVTLLDPDEVPDEELIIPTAMMGAPTVMIERIPRGDEALASLRDLEAYLGKKAYATMPIEAGGLNSTIPFTVAAKAGLPVVDADGMGRAFPELQMESFSVYGLPGSPIVIHDEKGNFVLSKTVDNVMLEWLARGVTMRMGGASHIAEYSMTGAEVKRTGIKNSPTLALKIGRAIREAHEKKRNPFEALMEVTEGTNYGKAIPLFKGKIVDVERRTTAGFAVGTVTIEGFDDEYKDKTLKIKFQNENLIATENGKILATVPDLISVMDEETGFAITTETLRYGFRVIVIGIPTPEIMRTPEALKVWGPKYFGYKDVDYLPLELMHKDYYKNARLSPEKEAKYRHLIGGDT